MTTINQKRESVDAREAKAAHLNWMGGQSFDITNPLTRLRLAASSCFFGEPKYYEAEAHAPSVGLEAGEIAHLRETLNALDPLEWRSLAPAALMERCIDEALAADPEQTLREAVRLRQEEHIRVAPQVILVRAANHANVRGTGLVRRYAPEIIARADEPSTALAYQFAAYVDKPVPNALKRALRDALSKFSEYELGKYRMTDRKVKTVDVVNLVHPKSDAVAKLSQDKLRTTDETWEAIISKNGSTEESWTQALDVMGHMAMLRNVRNLLAKGVDPKLFLAKLVAGAPKGKQLPFRYISAYNAVKADAPGAVQAAIEECLKVSLGNLPEFRGRLISLCDNSGSAQGATTSSMGTMKVSTIANLTGVIAGMRAEDGSVGVFGDRLETFAVRKNASIFDQLERAEKLAGDIGESTENGIWIFWREALAKKDRFDHVFIFSDMQAGHGGLYGLNPAEYRDYRWGQGVGHAHIDVAKLIRKYRAEVNPNVLVYLVQVAGYQDTIVPEFYDRTYILGGWSDGLLRFAAEMAGLNRPPSQGANAAE